MSDQVNDRKFEDDIKKKHPDLVKTLEEKGISAKTARVLIEEEDIPSMEALKHLDDGTIDALGISATQKNVLKSVVKKLKNPSVADQGGIDATNCKVDIKTVQGEAGLAKVINEGGAGRGGGIRVDNVDVKADLVHKEGKLFPLHVENKDPKK